MKDYELLEMNVVKLIDRIDMGEIKYDLALSYIDTYELQYVHIFNHYLTDINTEIRNNGYTEHLCDIYDDFDRVKKLSYILNTCNSFFRNKFGGVSE